MNWQIWTVLAWIAAEALLAISRTGKERKPTTPRDVVLVVLEWSAMAALIIWGVR